MVVIIVVLVVIIVVITVVITVVTTVRIIVFCFLHPLSCCEVQVPYVISQKGNMHLCPGKPKRGATNPP